MSYTAVRFVGFACGLAALAVMVYSAPADAAKTKMGCERGKEKWNAAAGKCEPGTAKGASKKAAAKKPGFRVTCGPGLAPCDEKKKGSSGR